ncbi:MAG: helix-turn-helix domain-containing protein [Bacteroidales bacterium]|jgi:transcriptional regulator with XRE-family HTH domain|nr:helix-turn-helix domain-containing protein [Bacteroidales bacterium]
MSRIGKNIKKIRNVKGLSQQAFADIFQLSRGNVSSYEELRADPKIEVVVEIAKYFGIPLDDFIQKDLSVNELLKYNTGLVLETEDLKRNHRMTGIPYVSAAYLPDYIDNYRDEAFIRKLPHIVIPSNARFGLMAFEIEDQESLPENFEYKNGDILFYERVVKENIHRIKGRFGLMVDHSGIKNGVYREQNGQMSLYLNELVEYPFDIDSDADYWVLRAVYGLNN